MNHEQYDQKIIDALKRMHKFESTVPKEEWSLGWSWADVGVAQATINKMITLDLVQRTFSSNKSKGHMLTDSGKSYIESWDKLIQASQEASEIDIAELEKSMETLFDDIIGYDDLKELVKQSILTDKPIHILLVGPPALAKSLILLDIEKAIPNNSMWIVGSATSRAGLWDVVVERKPRVLLIDEIDKMPIGDTASLLSLMEKGRLVRTKVGRQMDTQLDVWVVASANRMYKMAPELISRFKVYQIKEYDNITFKEVVKKALCIHENLDEQSASEIANCLTGKTNDVRDAIRVARLSKRVGIQRAVELIITQ